MRSDDAAAFYQKGRGPGWGFLDPFRADLEKWAEENIGYPLFSPDNVLKFIAEHLNETREALGLKPL